MRIISKFGKKFKQILLKKEKNFNRFILFPTDGARTIFKHEVLNSEILMKSC